MMGRRSWADMRNRLKRQREIPDEPSVDEEVPRTAEPFRPVADVERDISPPEETTSLRPLEEAKSPPPAPSPEQAALERPAGSGHKPRAPEAEAPAEPSGRPDLPRRVVEAPKEDLPEPDAEEDCLLGHVISVAGSIVWGMFQAGSEHPVEIGNIIRLEGGLGRSYGIITSLKRDGRRIDDDRRLVEVRMLGEVLHGSDHFQCGVSQHPALDSPIYAADRRELLLIYRQPNASTVRLGTLRQADGLPAYAVTDQLLGKHFAVLGTTGAGKSCAVTVILSAILEANPFGHVVMLDPHNEYGQAFGESAVQLNPETLKLPYWLLNFEEISEVLVNKDSEESAYIESAILRDAILRARKQAAGEDDSDHITVDTPTPYRLSELVRIIKEDMGAFNRAEQVASFQHLIARIERVAVDRRFAFMFSSFMVQDNMRQVLSSILRIPVGNKPVTIIDLSGMPSEIVDVVVSVLCRLVFEFVLWTDRGKAPPILLVCEEAHRYVPRDDDGAFAPTKRAISRIAKEGRKYGLSLGLVTQRPAELSVSSLSQCNTIFALRMANEHDLKFVQHAIPDGSRWMTEAMPSLNTREAMVIGAGVSVPMHIRFDELPPERRPASTTPPFSSAWQEDKAGPELIDLTIHRWRHQIRDA